MAINTTTPFYYTSTDVGAPQITANNALSFLTVLKTCLVGSAGTAYGAKASAGWTIAFEDDVNVAIAFQMATGNKRFIRLGNSTNTGTSGYQDYSYFEVRGYNAMTDVNTGTNPFPSVVQRSSFRWAFAGDLAINTTTIIPWSICASGNFFYIHVHIGNAGNNQNSSYGCHFAGYFGDIVSYLPTDTMQTILSGFWVGTGLNTPGSPCWSTNNQWYPYAPFKSADQLLAANFDNFCYIYGSAQQVYGPYLAQPHWDEASAGGTSGGWAGGSGMPNPNSAGQFVFQKATLYENSNSPVLRGEMPGLKIPMHVRPFPDQYQLTLGTDTHVSWLAQPPSGNNAASYNVLVDITKWSTN